MATIPQKTDVLQHVDPSRRAFLRKLLVGTFAAPVIASFSMNGLSVDDADAGILCGNLGNGSCDDVGPYSGPRLFKVDFRDTNAANEKIRVRARFEVSPDGSEIAFTLRLSRKQSAKLFTIALSKGGLNATLTPDVGDQVALTYAPAGGLTSETKGVLTAGDLDPRCDTMTGVLNRMSEGCARLDVFLGENPEFARDTALRGSIIPIV